MQKLLSLPPNLVQSFHELERVNRTDWFCTSDPVGKKLGSGGGTSWLLEECYNEYSDGATFGEWLEKEKKNSSSCGWAKPSFTRLCTFWKDSHPVPVFRWERGQHLGQNLLSLQLPYMKKSCLWLRINSIH